MDMVPIREIFEVSYGANLELNKMTVDPNGIPFVGRSERNNGVTARVVEIAGKVTNPAGSLSIAGGGSVLATFLQLEPYYSGRDLFYAVPKIDMSNDTKLFYCLAIRLNRYRFNYGRQANRTLRDLLVPSVDAMPNWVAGGLERASVEFVTKLHNSV